MSSQSSNAIEFSFDGKNTVPDHATLEAVASAAGAKLDPDSIEVTSAAPAHEPASAAAHEPAAASSDLTAKPAADEDLIATHEIDYNGEKLKLTVADLKAGHLRHRDYTQKTQKLADHERDLLRREQDYQTQLTQRDQELQALDQFLRNQAAVDAYRTRAFGQPEASIPQGDPNQPPSRAEVAAIARYNAEAVRQATLRDMQAQADAARQATDTVQRRIDVDKLGTQIDSHIAALIDKSPLLKRYAGADIEDVAEELIGMASKFSPKTLDDAKQRLTEAAERKLSILQQLTEDDKKASAVKAAQLKSTSPDQPGGSHVKPAPGRKLSFDHKDRSARIDAGVETVRAFLDSAS